MYSEVSSHHGFVPEFWVPHVVYDMKITVFGYLQRFKVCSYCCKFVVEAMETCVCVEKSQCLSVVSHV